MNAPFFSVLVATYNQAKYLRETLDSVRRQTFTDWELVVVDDGSTDDTPRVIADWLESVDEGMRARVQVLRQENAGQSAAFEAGFELCRGRYIALLDSDDRWLPERLSVMASEATADPDAVLLFHPMWVIDADGKRTGDVRPRRSTVCTGDVRDRIRRSGMHVVTSLTSGLVIRADVFRKLLPMPTRRFRSAADSYLALGSCLSGPIRAVPARLGEYRIHQDGNYIRRIMSPEGLERQIEIQKTISTHLGLQKVVRRNSYYARNAFAAARLNDKSRWEQSAAYARLMQAIARDASIPVLQRLGFCGYWTAGFLAPKSGFQAMWQWFHRMQGGRLRLRKPLRSGH